MDFMPTKRKSTANGPKKLSLRLGLDTAVTNTVAAHRLPTNTTTYAHGVHRWFNFIAGYSPEFVNQCCIEAGLGKGDHLLDPFAGCATSLVAARKLGIQATGFEAHPVFARIGRAKLISKSTKKDVGKIKDVILKGLEHQADTSVLPEAPLIFLSKLFPERVLARLISARDALAAARLSKSDLAFMILSRVVDKSTHSQTDGIYKAPTSKKQPQCPEAVCEETIKMILDDLDNESFDINSDSTIYHHSSESMRELDDECVSIVVTSPPYLNNFDYAEMTRMLLYFWGMASSWGEITDTVRKHLIVNTTTALRGHKDQQTRYRGMLPERILVEVDEIVKELQAKKKERAGKKEYDYIVYPYFAQMQSVLSECKRTLKKDGSLHIMVADAALYGVHIAAPQILSSMLEALGMTSVRCDQVRKRGHRWILEKREGSERGLGEYHISAKR